MSKIQHNFSRNDFTYPFHLCCLSAACIFWAKLPLRTSFFSVTSLASTNTASLVQFSLLLGVVVAKDIISKNPWW